MAYRSAPCLAVFLRDAETGMWCDPIAGGGWRLSGLADGGGREVVTITTDPATGLPRCSCSSRRRRRRCRHVAALVSVGLLEPVEAARVLA
jgi:hypothetical protein